MFLYRSLYGHIFLFILSKNVRVEWLSHMVGAYLTFQGTDNLFSEEVVQFHILISNVWEFPFLHHQQLVLLVKADIKNSKTVTILQSDLVTSQDPPGICPAPDMLGVAHSVNKISGFQSWLDTSNK